MHGGRYLPEFVFVGETDGAARQPRTAFVSEQDDLIAWCAVKASLAVGIRIK